MIMLFANKIKQLREEKQLFQRQFVQGECKPNLFEFVEPQQNRANNWRRS